MLLRLFCVLYWCRLVCDGKRRGLFLKAPKKWSELGCPTLEELYNLERPTYLFLNIFNRYEKRASEAIFSFPIPCITPRTRSMISDLMDNVKEAKL